MLTTAMDKLFNLLVEHPRAIVKAGVFIPCGLRHLLGVEDDMSMSGSEAFQSRVGVGGPPEHFPGELRTG